MPLVYADTSVLFAFVHPRDEFSRVVMAAVMDLSPDFVYWPYLRYELRHGVRQSRTDRYGEIAWKALRAAEKTHARLSWQVGLRTGSILESADDLSAKYALKSDAGSADFFHVAAARRLANIAEIDGFWTCDAEQAKLARKAGLVVRQFELRNPPSEPTA